MVESASRKRNHAHGAERVPQSSKRKAIGPAMVNFFVARWRPMTQAYSGNVLICPYTASGIGTAGT